MEKENDLTGNNKASLKTDELSSAMKKLKEENPFVVPNNYFDDLTDTILRKIENRKKEKSRIISFYNYKLKPAYYIAASIILLIAITLFFNKKVSNDYDNNLAVLSWDEVADDNYFVYSDLNLYNVIEALVYTGAEIDYNSLTGSLNFLIEINNGNDSAGNSGAIIEYLVDEDIEVDYILDL